MATNIELTCNKSTSSILLILSLVRLLHHSLALAGIFAMVLSHKMATTVFVIPNNLLKCIIKNNNTSHTNLLHYVLKFKTI